MDRSIEHIAVKRLALVDQCGIGHDERCAFHIQLRAFVGGQPLHPHLVQKAQKGIMTYMVAVVNIGDADRNCRLKKRQLVREGYFYTRHSEVANFLSIMKLICVGRNYREHARELGNEAPGEPILFIKPRTAVVQPGRPVYYPDFTKDLHYECELIVRISRNGKYIDEHFAHKYFSDISLGIDFTARDVQQRQKEKGLPWEVAKAFDNSAVIGEWRPVSEALNPDTATFEFLRNGQLAQRGDARDMIFPVARIIAYASQFFTLQQGDVIFTGTPAGVGPVSIYDRLEGFLEGQKVLEADVR